ncbi:MAG: GntR family transcriptional regulator [Flavobacteriales bacterium]|nr:GntR family transcriptional regulator [Flavobacteriales bacterium]
MNNSKETSKLVKKASNDLMAYIRDEKQIPGILPAERILSSRFSVSRSTMVKAFDLLESNGILKKDEASRVIIRKPKADDMFALDDDTISKSEFVEQFILNKLANYEYKPGTYFSELEIAKESGTNTVTVREVVLKISKTGLIKKEPRQKWQVVALTKSMVKEITVFRRILEISALNEILSSDKNEAIVKEFTLIRDKHNKMLEKKEVDYNKFVKLENSMHKAIIKLANNRYLESAYESIFTIVQYHIGQPGVYQTNINKTIEEHLVLLNAIINWDKPKAIIALNFHLEQADEFICKVSETISNASNES